MKLLIIAGMPASGKSTVAVQIGKALSLPILEKDAIKEELFDTVGFNSYAEKRQLDVAATAVLLRVADAMLAAGQSFIIVNNFREDAADTVKALLARHGACCATVFFSGDADAFYKRYVARDLCCARHIGHAVQEHYPPREGDPLTHTMTREEFAEKFLHLGMDKFDVGGTRIEVDATDPATIDVPLLISKIKDAFAADEA